MELTGECLEQLIASRLACLPHSLGVPQHGRHLLVRWSASLQPAAAMPLLLATHWHTDLALLTTPPVDSWERKTSCMGNQVPPLIRPAMVWHPRQQGRFAEWACSTTVGHLVGASCRYCYTALGLLFLTDFTPVGEGSSSARQREPSMAARRSTGNAHIRHMRARLMYHRAARAATESQPWSRPYCSSRVP